MKPLSIWFIRLSLLATGLILISGCVAGRVAKFEGDQKTAKELKKIALVQVGINPPSIPIFPLIDAGLHRFLLNKNAKEIVDDYKKQIIDITDYLGKNLNEKSSVEVLYGKSLINSSKYSTLLSNNVVTYALTTNNSNFPEVILYEGTKNLFDFSKIAENHDAFDSEITNSKYKDNISNICRALIVDGIIVATIAIQVETFTLGGAQDRLYLKLYYFDSSGNLILKGLANTEQITTEPFASVYEVLLRRAYPLTEDLVKVIYETKPL